MTSPEMMTATTFLFAAWLVLFKIQKVHQKQLLKPDEKFKISQYKYHHSNNESFLKWESYVSEADKIQISDQKVCIIASWLDYP